MIKLFLTFLIPMWKYAKDPEQFKLSHQCFVSGLSVPSSLSQCCRNWPVRVYANDNAKNSSTGVPLYLSYIFKIIHRFHGNSPKDHQQECWLTLTRGEKNEIIKQFANCRNLNRCSAHGYFVEGWAGSSELKSVCLLFFIGGWGIDR